MSDIRINSISKSYGDKQVLSGFSALLPAKGKTVIMYSWGNQHGKEFLAMAEYDGSLQELLESFFLK